MAYSGADLYVGGDFQTAGGFPASNIARWDGARWWPLGNGVDGSVLAMEATSSRVFAAGRFWRAGNKPSRYFAVWHVPGSLEISKEEEQILLSWPAANAGLHLETTTQLSLEDWVQATIPGRLNGGRMEMKIPILEEGQFFRLKRTKGREAPEVRGNRDASGGSGRGLRGVLDRCGTCPYFAPPRDL